MEHQGYRKDKKYSAFGCTWIIDNVYKADDIMNENNQFGLLYPYRYTAHVIKSPQCYEGIREIDAAITQEFEDLIMVNTEMVTKAKKYLDNLIEKDVYPDINLVPIVQYVCKCSKRDAEFILDNIQEGDC